MGEDNSGILFVNGEPIFNITKMPEITFDSKIDNENIIGTFPHDRSCSFTGIIKHAKMSRKKFVHNLIKQGHSKKSAKNLAWYCHKKRIPYINASDLMSLGLFVVR